MTHEEALAEAVKWAKFASRDETWAKMSIETIKAYATVSQAWTALAREIRESKTSKGVFD